MRMSKRKSTNYDVMYGVSTDVLEDNYENENNDIDIKTSNNGVADYVDYSNKYETNNYEDKNTEKYKVCKVVKFISKEKAIVDFEGNGLIVQGDFSVPCAVVNVQYYGEIGNSDFKYEVAK